MKLNNRIQSGSKIFAAVVRRSLWLRTLLTGLFVLIISPLVTLPVYASPLEQDADPVTQCSQGVQLYFEGEYSKALPLLEAGFVNRDAALFADPDDLGICALVLGGLLSPDYKALTAYQTALTIFQESGNKEMQGITLNNLGMEYQMQGNYADALDSYLQASLIAQTLGDKQGESITLNNIGLVYQSQGRYTNALDAFQRALILAREIGDRENEGAVLNGIGMVYDSQGRYPEALELFQEALNITQELGNRPREGITWNNIGAVYESQGRYAEALESYQRALGISLEAGDQASERTMLNNIGQIYASQGRHAEALGYYEKSLAISEELRDVASRGTTLNNIGQVFSAQGHYTEALAYFQEALKITRQVGNREVEGITLVSIGLTYEAQDQYVQALESFNEALQIQRAIGDRESEGATLHNIGQVLKAQGQYFQALEYYQSALLIDREVGNREGEAVVLSHIGLIYELQDKHPEALEYYENAIEVLETIRSSAGSETARSAFISKYSETYDRAVILYIKEGLPEKAFLASERGRSRAFLDSIATGYVELGDNESSTLYKNEQEAFAVRKNLQDALDLAKSQNPPDENLIADLEEQLALANAGYQASIDAITTRQDQLAQLVSGRKTVLDVKQVQTLLDDESILLSYWITNEQTFVFIMTRNSFDIVSLNLTHSDLSDKIESFTTFANIETSHPNGSIELYKSLIQPLKPYLDRPHLVIVPHRELHYIPFAAFSDGSNYLLDDYMITYVPSASALPFIDENARDTGGTPLIMGNPTTGNYDITSSLATQRDQLGPLPFAEEETEVIAKLLGVDPYIQINATETLVKQRARSTSILHFAAHGLFNPTVPLNSLVALAPDKTNDGWLTVSEVYGLDLSNADLIVLSACETQIGQLTAGDEFVGLTRAFFFAGAPTVIASLWSVEDKSTALLMEQFYAHRLEGMGKGEALRQAQIDTRQQYPNPYYWAGFVLSGDAGNDHKLISAPTEAIATEPGNTPCASISLLLIVFMLPIRRS